MKKSSKNLLIASTVLFSSVLVGSIATLAVTFTKKKKFNHDKYIFLSTKDIGSDYIIIEVNFLKNKLNENNSVEFLINNNKYTYEFNKSDQVKDNKYSFKIQSLLPNTHYEVDELKLNNEVIEEFNNFNFSTK